MTVAFDQAAFSEWIVSKGGAILPSTNEWEVLRYRTITNETGVIYRNKKGAITYTPRSRADLEAFLKETNFVPAERVNRLKAEWSAKTRAALLERDGPCCCYCGQFVDRGDLKPTIEHFHAIGKTGNNHHDNLALACEPCNAAVGSAPVIRKMEFRDKARKAVAVTSPWEVCDTRGAAA